MTTIGDFGFSGGGNMGEALIRGLLQSGRAKPKSIFVFDPAPSRTEHLQKTYGVTLVENNQTLVSKAGVIVLAVKPQNVDEVLREIGGGLKEDQLVVSIAAGVTLARIQGAIAAQVPVIRVMPNTPALVLSGAAALAKGKYAGAEHLAVARNMFESVGLAVEVEEKYLDVVTGLSGSGPAYIFVLLEALTDGAVRLGLPRDQARLLAAQTILGAAKLALETGDHPGRLKDMVTSPGGTTAAGLYALERGGFRGLVMEAVAAATLRCQELGAK